MKMMIRICAIILLSTAAFAEEISQMPVDKPTTVTNIIETAEKKVKLNVYECIKDIPSLQTLYEYENVREIFNAKIHTHLKCDSVIKELESINETRKSIIDYVNGDICTASLDETTGRDIVEQKKKLLEDVYSKSSQEYAKFFAYDENMGKFEGCLSKYTEIATVQEIEQEEASKKTAKDSKRKLLEMHDLSGFYGENRNATGSNIHAMISDIENKNVTLKEAKSYAVMEEGREKWELSGSIIGYLIYSYEKKFVALPFVRGISYSCDQLPYTIFKLEKKIEIPERDYTIYLLEPLE